MSCPNTIQNIERTLIPFRNRRFSFSLAFDTATIFEKLWVNEKHLTTLIGNDYDSVILGTTDPVIPKMMINARSPITQ